VAYFKSNPAILLHGLKKSTKERSQLFQPRIESVIPEHIWAHCVPAILRKEATCEISCSHGGEDVDVGILGYNAVWTCRYLQTFRRNILPPYSGMLLGNAVACLPAIPSGVTKQLL
jgi:hypothetical protein